MIGGRGERALGFAAETMAWDALPKEDVNMGQRLVVLLVWIIALPLAPIPGWAGPVQSGAEAEGMVRTLVARRTPPLDVGVVREVGQSYEVEVVTRKGTLVDRLLVEKASGRIRSLYGRMLMSLEPSGGLQTATPPGAS